MWRGTVEPLYKGTGKLPCGGDNILMGPPSWEAVSPSNIYISKDFFFIIIISKKMNTKHRVKVLQLWTSTTALAVQFDTGCESKSNHFYFSLVWAQWWIF